MTSASKQVAGKSASASGTAEASPSKASPYQSSGTAEASTAQAVASQAPPRPARVWPALVLIVGYWIGFAVVNSGAVSPFPQFMFLFWGPMLVAVLLVVWWLLLSRMALLDRFWGVAWLAIGGALTWKLAHKTIAPPPMPMGLIVWALPVALTAVVVWLVVTRGAAKWWVRMGVVAASLAAWGYFMLLRCDGLDGNLSAERYWRWTPTSEDKLLAELSSEPAHASAQSTDQPVPVTTLPAEAVATDWPEFRGAARDSAVHGITIDPDWKAHPPQKVWSRRVGPGWSSFTVIGGVAFTQEQRGENEAVVCFDVASGNELWLHAEPARFEEVVAGAGPRATPTFVAGKLYTQGASGKLNCLDAATGNAVWSRDIRVDAGLASPPMWGFASSPLVTHGTVLTFAGGKDGKSVLAYDAATGEPRWHAGHGTHSYSSPQLLTLYGVPQVLMASDYGLESFDPESGQPIWEHHWDLGGMYRVCQPQLVGNDRILLGTGMVDGARLLSVTHEADAWKATELWTSKDMKPYFNDYVQYDGYLYGFDGPIFSCIDLETGKKQWQKRGYGHGQVLLLADQGVMIVISEKGDLVLIEASPKNLIERGKLKVLAGKTWNHPVLTGTKLLVRNDEEMACFEVAK